ncbi:MAG: hypothetical protein JXA21_21705 [Anaerolineae bacterium]|nr:hypothetical protein [Anaerolineae bacterium]
MTTPSVLLFDKTISRPRPLWVTVCISLLLLVTPVTVLTLDGAWSTLLGRGYWRLLFLSPVILIYILVIAPVHTRSGASVVASFRSLALVEDAHFDLVVQRTSRISRVGEVVALGVGLLFGLWQSIYWRAVFDTPWIKVYISMGLSIMFGLLVWIIYGSIISTRLISVLHSLPLRVDILNLTPFESIGRHSLATTLIFVGGIVLGIIFGLDVENILAWQTWFFYALLGVVPVLIFFLSMRPTHRVLRDAKQRELAAVTERLQRTRALLRQHIVRDEAFGATAAEFNALTAYEKSLRAAQTWSYNTSMLRTLVVSLLMPLLVRVISKVLLGQ